MVVKHTGLYFIYSQVRGWGRGAALSCRDPAHSAHGVKAGRQGLDASHLHPPDPHTPPPRGPGPSTADGLMQQHPLCPKGLAPTA